MENCRAKKLVKLALAQTQQKLNPYLQKIDEFTFENKNDEEKEDPWADFKEWKRNEVKKSKDLRENTDTGLYTKIEYQDSSHETNFINSPESWKPSEVSSSSTSFQSSIVSKEIPIQKVIEFQTEAEIPTGLNSKTEDLENNRLQIQDISLTQNNVKFNSADDNENDNYLAEFTEEPTPVPNSECSTSRNEMFVGVIGESEKVVEVSNRKCRVWDKRDRCLYCYRDVTNFSRHLFRNHQKEESVGKIMLLEKGDRKRKQMLNLLRNEGNLTLVDENKIRPVQRVTKIYGQRPEGNVNEFMPCPYCKGIYRLASLRKHSKKCSFNPLDGEKKNFASLGQNILIFKESRKAYLDKLRLTKEVFSNMHADRASFNGKNDPVICQYADDYLRKHKRPHIKHAVSNKVRELGRLLIPLKDIYGINSMLQALNTEHYGKVVHAARIIAGYDEKSKTFKAPSLAMHMKTILLGACLAAKTLLSFHDPILPVNNYTEALKIVKNFRALVEERWKFDMGSLALKDLNEKHGKKSQSLPITSDVLKFRKYATDIAEKSMQSLQKNIHDTGSFKALSEAALALTILINRKRVGDVQYIKMNSYTEDNKNVNQEEVLQTLTDSEKLWMNHFKRIITIGKGSKSIPILFPKNVQTYIDALLLARSKNRIIPESNPFLFAAIGSKDKWINGSSVLRKYANMCGAENPKTLTSSRLRKQIATVLQVINLSETEKEQVAGFMGHTKKTHEDFYRLPQDVFQTAKIAKLLIMMDRGEGGDNHGKTLEEIDLQLENLIGADNGDTDLESEGGSDVQQPHTEQDFKFDEYSNNEKGSQVPIEKKKTIRGSWTKKQKSVLLEYFKKNIQQKITPKKQECLDCQKKYAELLSEKTWVQIKIFVYNTFRNMT